MNVAFSAERCTVQTYDYFEVEIWVDRPAFGNPFIDAEVFGQFGPDIEPFTFKHGLPDGLDGTATSSDHPVPVDGFCDSPDGSLFRIRFMPVKEGQYRYTVVLKHGNSIWSHEGTFQAERSTRKGLLKVDPVHPFHFIWEGTGEHFFYNSLTAYHLPGIRNIEEIERILVRFADKKVNRLRVSISSSRVTNGTAWFEPVYDSEAFTFQYAPWQAERPDNPSDPGFDKTRFDILYWQKLERILERARELDIVISVIMYVDAYRVGADPYSKLLMGGQDEQRYYRYAAARLAAFSNVTWDITNEYRLIRPREWVERMGHFLRSCDPYHHLTSCHGHETFEFRTSGWADFALYQCWDKQGGYDFMLRNRTLQLETGRPIPQVNEEFGYEDHYPTWGGEIKAPMRSADALRRVAWHINMAGGYQTAGEYAGNGVGGWVNGRADDTMTLPDHLASVRTFFESCDWWRTAPDNGPVVSNNGYCLAEPGRLYLVYLPSSTDSLSIRLEEGTYEAVWYNPRTGKFVDAPIKVNADESPVPLCNPDSTDDMALRIVRVDCT